MSATVAMASSCDDRICPMRSLLFGDRLRFQVRQQVVEAVVLAQDPSDRGLVLGEQCKRGEVHLPRQHIFDLLRRADALVRLIEQLALSGRAELREQAHDSHRDEQQRHDQKAAQKLGMDGGADSREPTHQRADRRSLKHPHSQPL
jgi:hypothetical protein